MKEKNSASRTRGMDEAKAKLSGAHKGKGFKPAPTHGGAKYVGGK